MAKGAGPAEPVGLRRLTRTEQHVLVGKRRHLKIPARIPRFEFIMGRAAKVDEPGV